MDGKKHILFISSWYPNKNNPGHGIFNRYFAQAVSLLSKVSVIHVSSDSNQQNAFEIVEEMVDGITEIHVYYKKVTSTVPFFSNWLKLKKQKQAFELGYKRLLEKEKKPDLMHINVILPSGIGAQHLAKRQNIPYVVNENWSGYCAEDGNYKGLFMQYFTKKIIGGAKAILPTSQFLKEAMLSHGLNGNYEIVPNVTNVNRFVPGNKHSEAITRFIHISSLTDREKNVSGIIRAFTKALEKNSAMELLIVGEGDERENHVQYAKAINTNEKIKFTGRLLGNDIINAINSSDALLMFSHFETFCLVIIEAFACGKPVVTSNAGAIKSYMKPELGIMVEKGNEQQLMDAIVKFAETKSNYDSAFIRNYAVENYSYEKVGAKLNGIYVKVLKG